MAVRSVWLLKSTEEPDLFLLDYRYSNGEAPMVFSSKGAAERSLREQREELESQGGYFPFVVVKGVLRAGELEVG